MKGRSLAMKGRSLAVNTLSAPCAGRLAPALLVGLALGAALSGGALGLGPNGAEPARASAIADTQPERTDATPPDIAREALRTALVRRLAGLNELEASLRDAIDALDRGAELDEVRDALPDREQIAAILPRPDGPGDRGDGPPGRLRDRLRERPDDVSDEQLDRVRAFIAEHIPPLDDRLDRAAERSPRAERRLLRRLAPRLLDTVRLAERDPDAARLRVREMRASFDVVDAMRDASRADAEEARASARQSLIGALRRQYEARLAFERRDLDREFERLRERERTLQRRADEIDRVVEQRADELMERAERWTGTRGRRGGAERDARGTAGRRD